MTRATIDQWKRNLRQQFQQKVQTLNSLRAEVEDLLTDMQKKTDSVLESVQVHHGQPRQLEMSLKQEFNERSQIVQTLDTKICKTVKQVRELQKTITAAIGKGKTGLEVLQIGHAMPTQPCTIKESGLPSVQP